MRPVIILIFLLAACAIPVLPRSDAATVRQEKAKLRLIIPKDDWEPNYFKEINKRAKSARLPKLRSTVLPKDDLEARVWFGFGTFSLGGFRVKRSAGQWSAAHLDGIHPEQIKLPPPKSGWEACWKRLVDQGLLTLPDSSELKDENRITDGYGYVVEINMNGTYRTYHYMSPAWQKWPESRQMMKLSNIIYEEFGLPEFRIRETSP
jgi:hypothetical protein